jgi:hypothetical protein
MHRRIAVLALFALVALWRNRSPPWLERPHRVRPGRSRRWALRHGQRPIASIPAAIRSSRSPGLRPDRRSLSPDPTRTDFWSWMRTGLNLQTRVIADQLGGNDPQVSGVWTPWHRGSAFRSRMDPMPVSGVSRWLEARRRVPWRTPPRWSSGVGLNWSKDGKLAYGCNFRPDHFDLCIYIPPTETEPPRYARCHRLPGLQLRLLSQMVPGREEDHLHDDPLRQRTGERHVFSVNANGSDVTQLTTHS